MRRHLAPVLLLILLCTSIGQAAPYRQAPGSPVVVVSNAGQAVDPPDRVLWRAGNDISDPAANWREPAYDDSSWNLARPAWRGRTWASIGPPPMNDPTGPDHIWYSNAGALTPDTGNGIDFATRFDGTSDDNGYLVPPGPDVLFLRKNFCLPLNAVPLAGTTGQLEIMGIDEYVAWMNGTSQVALGGGPVLDTLPVYSAIVPLYPGHNVLAIRARNLGGQDTEAALIYRLAIDYAADSTVLTIAGPADIIVGQPATFTGQVNGLPGDPPYTYDWALGDGSTASGDTVAHTYAVTGTLTISLTVTDDYGCPGVVTMPITVHDAPLLAIAKSDTPDPVVEGGMLDYSLVVHNGGTIALAGVTVTDTVPANTTYVNCGGAPCSQAGGVVTWTGIDVPSGGDATITFRVQVDTGITSVVNDHYGAAATGALPAAGLPVTTTVVQATATPLPTDTPLPTATLPGPTVTPPPPSETPQPTVPPPTSTPGPTSPRPPIAPTEPLPSAYLVLTHAVAPDSAAPDDTVVYHTTVTNTGATVAHNVVVDIEIPLGLAPGQFTITPSAPATWAGNTLWVAWGDLAPGGAFQVDIPATVGTAVSGDVVSTAQVQEYGLAGQAVLHVRLALLPTTATVVSWVGFGTLCFAGALVVVGLLLRRSRPGQAR
jgi:uncharacterized repeat protein (TIGR01451 family)